MGIKNYNDNEEKFLETLKALKELPKINVPDNFEFNLMVKINNGEFAPEVEEKRQSKLLWIFAPAAMVVTTVILFITFSRTDLDQQLNPLTTQGSIYAGKMGELPDSSTPTPKSAPVREARRGIENRSSAPVQQQALITESLPGINEYTRSPLSREGSFRLDNLSKGLNSGVNRNTFTARDNQGFGSIPEDLLLKSKPQDKKAVQDSLRKLADSLKLKKNSK